MEIRTWGTILLSHVIYGSYFASVLVFVIKNQQFKIKSNLIAITPLLIIWLASPFYFLGILEDAFVIINFLILVYLLINLKILIIYMRDKYKIFIILLANFVVVNVFYLYDAENHITIGHQDTISSYSWIKSFFEGFNGAYQPGYALFSAPIISVIDWDQRLNYLGSILGIWVLFSVLLLLLNNSKILPILFITILFSPIFIEVNKTIIGLNSSSISFLFLLLIVYLLIDYYKGVENTQIYLILVLIPLGLTAPVLNFYVIPTLFLISGIYIFYKKSFFFSLYPSLLSFISLILYGLHSYYYLFSSITVISGSQIVSDGSVNDSSTNDALNNLAFDAISTIGGLREITSYLEIFGYFFLMVYISILIFALKKHKSSIIIVSSFGLVFSLITLTGILDLSFFKGRSGWYLLFITIYFTTLMWYEYFSKFIPSKYVLIAALALGPFYYTYYPITHYRYHDEIIFYLTKDVILAQKDITKRIIYTDIAQMHLIHDSVKVMSLNKISDQQGKRDAYYVLDFKTDLVDPVLSREYTYLQTKNGDFQNEIKQGIIKKLQQQRLIEKSLLKHNAQLLVNTGSYKIYFLQ